MLFRTEALAPTISVFVFSLAGVAWLWIHATDCDAVAECRTTRELVPLHYHVYVAIGLFTLFIREAVVLIATLKETIQTPALVKKDRVRTQFFMCAVLAALTSVEVAFANGAGASFSHAMPTAPNATTFLINRPVRTMRYMEWLVTVPILLTLAGHCALRRPMKEVVHPILITNAYILLAWGAMVTEVPRVRWSLVFLTFAGYYFASAGMVKWVYAFWDARTQLEPSSSLTRALSVGLLIGVFGIYAVIYLLALTGGISDYVEHLSFTFSGFATKVTMSVLFTSIRFAEDGQALADLLSQIKTMNRSFMSILKGSFDSVVLCVADSEGGCVFSSEKSPDVEELERRLGRHVAGKDITALLAGDLSRTMFRGHVRNVLRQAETVSACAVYPGEMSKSPTLPSLPVAQVLHCTLEASIGGTSTSVGAAIHLSALPKHTGMPSHQDGKTLIAAISFNANSAEPVPDINDAAAIIDAEAQARQLMQKGQLGATAQRQLGERVAKGGKKKGGQKKVRISSKQQEKEAAAPASLSAAGEKEGAEGVDGAGIGGKSSVAAVSEPDVGSRGEHESLAESDDKVLLEELHIKGGPDVASQSSKESHVGSVHMACRQLLGPLMDKPPPAQLMSRKVEDHLSCAAEMVRMKGPATINRFHHEQQLAEWQERCRGQLVSELLSRSKAPESQMDETLWCSEVLPRIRGQQPGEKPVPEGSLDDDETLWLRAWQRTYEEEEDEDEEESSEASSQT